MSEGDLMAQAERDVPKPRHFRLRELIDALESEDATLVVPVGFANPHSYRGMYEQLAFEITKNVTVGSMLEAARSALGATYQGWKGGDFTMKDYTDCWLVEEEGSTGETIGAVLLDLMLHGRAGEGGS